MYEDPLYFNCNYEDYDEDEKHRKSKGKFTKPFRKRFNKNLSRLSIHGAKRMRQRSGTESKLMTPMVIDAYHNGQELAAIKPGPLQNYMLGIKTKKGLAIKYYHGSIYLFNRKTKILITYYPIPPEVAAAQAAFESK